MDGRKATRARPRLEGQKHGGGRGDGPRALRSELETDDFQVADLKRLQSCHLNAECRFAHAPKRLAL
jgi:hypothetical protein